MATLSQRVAKNALFQMVGKGLSVVIGAVAFSFMARYLGKEGYGDYTTITTFAIFFSTMADFGFYFIAVRDISKPNARGARIFGNAFTMRLVASVFFVLLAPLVAVLFFDYSSHVELGILIAAFSTFFISINQILVAIFQKVLRTDQVALAEVAGRLVFLGSIVVLTLFDYGVLSFVWALGVSNFINFGILFLSSRNFLKFRLQYDKEKWAKIFKAAWPIGLVIIINLFYFRFNIILLSALKPAEDVGIFGAAYKIIEILIALPAIFVGLVIPLLSRFLEENKRKFREVFDRSFNALILIAV
ncbi:oligosaccharide flippase family protein, partial [Patescibacteria group bacterium]